jgi:hypothetical protein
MCQRSFNAGRVDEIFGIELQQSEEITAGFRFFHSADLVLNQVFTLDLVREGIISMEMRVLSNDDDRRKVKLLGNFRSVLCNDFCFHIAFCISDSTNALSG